MLNNDARVTLVCAPAGFGKSTLIREWLDHVAAPVLFYAFPSRDQSAARMWAALLRDLTAIDPRRNSSLLTMFAATTVDDAQLVGEFVDEAAGVEGLTVILEDLQNIGSDSLLRQVRMLVEMLADDSRVILTSRQRPDLPLALLASRGDLVELGAGELCLTFDEVRELADRSGHGTDVTEILDATDGWPAGVGLLLRSAPWSGSRREQQNWSATSDIAELLRSEVLTQLPEDRRRFLTSVGFLDAWSPGLCDAVAATDEGGEILRELATTTFVLRVDGSEKWYRPHQLLGDLLREDFDRLPDGERATLRRRAARWFEAKCLPVEAVQQALAAGDDARAVDLVLANAFALSDAGEQQLIAQVLRSPAAERADDPSQLLKIAVALGMTGQGAATLGTLDRIDRLHDLDGRVDDRIRGRAAIARCIVSSFAGDVDSAEGSFYRAIELLGRLPSDETVLRTRLNLARCLRLAGRLDDAERFLRELMLLSDETETTASVFARASWSQVLLDRGELARAREQADLALRLWDDRGMARVVGITDALRTIATHTAESGDLDRAAEARQEAVRASTSIRPGMSRALVMTDLARAAALTGDTAGAHDALADVRGWWPDFPPGPQLRHVFHVAQFVVALAEGDLELAAAAVGMVDGLDGAVAHPYAPLLRAQLHLRRGEGGRVALATLDAQPSAPLPRRIETLLVRSWTESASGDSEAALASTVEALELGLPAGFRRTFARCSQLWTMPHHLIAPELLGAFREALEMDEHRRSAPTRPSFTERELEVLRLLPTHLSYSGIAAELYISVNTAKFHVKNLYTKLDVGDRESAVGRARDLGLFD